MHEDAITIEAIKLGNRDRYAELVDRHSRLVYGIAWSRLGDSALSEDAAQEAFVQGFRFLGTLRRPERFAAWIGRIARNVSSRIARRHRRALDGLHRWQLDQDASAARGEGVEAPFDRPVQDLLSDTLDRLTDTHRECLVLFYLKSKSIREAADTLGISENAFKTRLHRARADLREKLEAQLGPAIEKLRPQDRLRDKVLAVIPMCPIGWGGKGLSLGTFIGGLQTIGLSVLPILPTMLLVGWAGHGMARNYRAGGEFRKRILWQNYLLLGLFLIPWLVAAGWLRYTWGSRTLFTLLAIYTLPALAQGILTLRVNRSSFIIAVVVGTASMVIGFLAMGVLGLPFVWFLVAMLIFNVGLWPGLKSLPARGDYNLFLRAAMGGLREPRAQGDPLHSPSAKDLRAFARFLGERFLVIDYSLRRSGCILYLPPVRNSLVASFLWPIARFNGSSFVTIAPDGTCRANLSSRDAHLLRSHASGTMLDSSTLQQQVSTVVTESLRLFLLKNELESARLLQAQDDQDIFFRPVHQLARMRVLFLVSIMAAFIGLAGFWISGQRFIPAPERVVTAGDARAAVVEWVSADQGPGCMAHGNLTACMTAYPLPPASFWPSATAEALRRFGLEEIRRLTRTSRNGVCDFIYSNGLMVHNLLTGGYVSITDLRSAGLTREALLEQVDRMGLRGQFGQPPFSHLPDVNRQATTEADSDRPLLRSPHIHDNLRMYAYRLWCLKQLGMLDAFDTADAAEILAGHQITENQPTTNSALVPADAAGLFWVSEPFWLVEDTWAVLFSLQTLGKLDAIDREACVAGLMRCYRGKGDFTGACNSRKAGNPELVQMDAYYALESLAILGALDKVADLHGWSFHAMWCQYRNDQLVAPFVTPAAIGTWAWQSRLDGLRRQAPSSSASR